MSLREIVCHAIMCPFGLGGKNCEPYPDEDSNNVYRGVSCLSVIPVGSAYALLALTLVTCVGIASSRMLYSEYEFQTGCKGNDTIANRVLCKHQNYTYSRLSCSGSSIDGLAGCFLVYGLLTSIVIALLVLIFILLVSYFKYIFPEFCRSFQRLRQVEREQQGAYTVQVDTTEEDLRAIQVVESQ